jgi:hypothetical protein
MCKADNYLSQLEFLTSRINSDYKKLCKKQSEYDKMLSDKYHQLENAKFNACEGYYHARQLQDILRARRMIKDEVCKLDILRDSLGKHNLTKILSSAKSRISGSRTTSNQFIGDWQHTYNLDELLEGGE